MSQSWGNLSEAVPLYCWRAPLGSGPLDAQPPLAAVPVPAPPPWWWEMGRVVTTPASVQSWLCHYWLHSWEDVTYPPCALVVLPFTKH